MGELSTAILCERCKQPNDDEPPNGNRPPFEPHEDFLRCPNCGAPLYLYTVKSGKVSYTTKYHPATGPANPKLICQECGWIGFI